MSPGLRSEQPPSWLERVPLAQVCGLRQGPRRSEHEEGAGHQPSGYPMARGLEIPGPEARKGIRGQH